MKNLINFLTIAVIIIIAGSSCNTYYKAVSIPAKNSQEKTHALDSIFYSNRYIILRNGFAAFHVQQPHFSTDSSQIECNLDTLSPYNRVHLTHGRRGKFIYKKYDPMQNNVLNEAHIYIKEDSIPAIGKFSVAVNKIDKIELIKKNKSKTTTNHILGGLAIAAGITLIAGIIFAATFTLQLGGL